MADSGNKSGAAHKDTGKRFDPDFFTLPSRAVVIPSLIFQYFVLAIAFAPNTFPAFLGAVGSYARDVGINHPHLCIGLVVVIYGGHVIEAIQATRLCRELQLTESASRKWIIAVAVFGIFSLNKLRSLRKSKAA